MTLFLQEIHLQADEKSSLIKVIFQEPGAKEKQTLEIPLVPNTEGLKVVNITLHQSPTKAYAMDDTYNTWFSRCFGYEVILVYLGTNLRPILGSFSPKASIGNGSLGISWLSSITQFSWLRAAPTDDKEGLTFADCAAYLIVTEESLEDVSSRLSGGFQMDITKFRPNIVLSGSSAAFEEDFWAGLSIKSTVNSDAKDKEYSVSFDLTQNCVRCRSINIDYATGKPGSGETGTVLKKLMKDRRIDKGAKFTPVFGRYGFFNSGSSGTANSISLGDEVEVTRRNDERTTFGKCLNVYNLQQVYAKIQ